MNRYLICLFVALSIISCKKNNTACKPVAAADEAPQIAAFCSASNIDYNIDSNGIYYQVVDQGSGIKPNENSTITATYIATMLDGKVIEDKTSTPVTEMLSQFIEGWRIAIPYIQKGGHIKMVIPSSLAFSCTGTDMVPPNSPLYYDVVLVNVQ